MIKHLSILITLALSSSYCFADDNITWIAQDYPPYSYVDSAGNNTGIAIDIASSLMQDLNTGQTAQSIALKVFSKFFIMTHNHSNTVFFPMLRLPAREEHFKWVGPIAINEPVLMAKTSSNISIKSPSDLDQYSVASIEDYVGVTYLTTKGVKNKVFKLNSSDLEGAKLLISNSVNMIACDKLACHAALLAAGADLASYSIVYKMPTSEFYFAINKDTSTALITQIQTAFDKIKKKDSKGHSQYEAIVKKYSH